MVRKDECSVRTIVVVVVHLPMLRRVLVEISMVRRDLCHFCDSSLAEHCFTHPFVSGDAPRFFLLRFSKSCSADRFPFRSRPREASSQPHGSDARTDVLQLYGTFGAPCATDHDALLEILVWMTVDPEQNLEKDHSISAHGDCSLRSHRRQWVG